MRAAVLAGWTIVLSLSTVAAREFTSASAPFHVSLLSLHREREVVFVRGPWIQVDDRGVQHATEARPGTAGAASAPDLYARLRIHTDPPAHFRQNGPPRLDEAVDDLGQTLELLDTPGPNPASRGTAQHATYTARDFRLPLSLPQQPGRVIKRLKGAVPVVVATRSAQPRLTFDLMGLQGQSVDLDEAEVAFLDVSVKPDRSAVVKIQVRLDSEKGNRHDREYQEALAARVMDVVQLQLDLVDDQTRPVSSFASTVVRRNEVRATLTVRPSDAYGAPDRVRVWDLARAAREVPFDYENVPLP